MFFNNKSIKSNFLNLHKLLNIFSSYAFHSPRLIQVPRIK
jgi:hypothetical protein